MGTAEPGKIALKKTEPGLRFSDRLKLALISELGYWIIRIIGGTLRWKVEGWHIFTSTHHAGRQNIGAFWHGRIFMAAYWFRHRGIVVMTSQNRDGEYIARVIRRLGYGAARGSSTRGSRGAIVELLHAMKEKKDVAFTIDGPRGPRYVAKPGAAFLACKSGNPVMPFNISAEKKWVINSWDHFMVPKPFSRALLSIGPLIYVNPKANEEELRHTEEQIQQSLDELRDHGDSYWGGPPDR